MTLTDSRRQPKSCAGSSAACDPIPDTGLSEPENGNGLRHFWRNPLIYLAEWTATQNAPQSMSQGVTGYYQIMKAPNCVVLLSPIAPHPVPAAAMGALMGCTTPRTGLCVREGQANQEIRSAASINFRMHHWSRSESLSVASTITCSPPFCSVIV